MDSQLRVIPTRNPIGLTFCPMIILLDSVRSASVTRLPKQLSCDMFSLQYDMPYRVHVDGNDVVTDLDQQTQF